MNTLLAFLDRSEDWIYGGSLLQAIVRGSLVFIPLILLGTWCFKFLVTL